MERKRTNRLPQLRFSTVLYAYAATERTLAALLSAALPNAYNAARESLRLADDAQTFAKDHCERESV